MEEGVLRVTVRGPAVAAGRIAVDDLVLLVRQVQAAVERIALVLRGEQGARRGRRPGELERLTRLEVVAFRSGSVVLEFDLRRDQVQLEGLDPGREAVTLLVEGLISLACQEGLPRGWDSGVLLALREVGSLFRRGIEEVELSVPTGRGLRSGTFTAREAERVARLITEPVTNRRTVEGRLLMADFKEWATRCRVHPPMGPPVECTFDDAHRQVVLDALTRYVRVTGEAELDPDTGRIRRLAIADIEILDEEGGEEVEYPFWETVDLEALAVRQGVKPVERVEDWAADIWESAEELEQFLQEVYAGRIAEEDA